MTEPTPLPEDIEAERRAREHWRKQPAKVDERCTRNAPLYMVIYPPGARVSCPVHGWHWFGPNAGLMS